MLKAGFAKVDVTPPLGSPVAGYYRERYADGILDPIELVALAVNDGENTAVIITADFLGMWEKWATEIRNLISERCSIPAEHVYIACLHQHTSVRIGKNPHLYNEYGYGDFVDSAYYDVLYRKFADAAQMAIADMCDAEMSVAQKETAEELSFIRRFKMKTGETKTNPKRTDVDKIDRPLGEADNTVRLVRFKREGAKDIALVNFSTHPDVIGGNKFTADWPGFVRRMTEKDIPDTNCILLNGAQGDTNHVNRFVPPTELKGYEFSEHMARVITDVVVEIWDKTEEREGSKVTGQVQMKYIPTNTSRMDEVEECRRLKKAHAEGADILHSMAERADVFRVANLLNQSLFQQVVVSLIGIGDVALVGFGGEPFTQYAADARAAAPDKFVICSCCTNGYSGYFPTKEAFAEGGYEGKSTNFTVGLADTLNQTVKEMLENHEAR